MQIAEYVGQRRQRIVEYVGSAHTPAELGVLMARARERLAEYERPGQGVFDLGLAVEEPVALVPAPADPEMLTGLGVPASRVAAASPVPSGLVSAGRVVSTASNLLFEVLVDVYESLGFGALGDAVFRDLVVARVVEPTSILDVPRVLGELGHSSASDSTLRRTLRRAWDGDYRDQLARICFKQAQTSGDISLCLYDVTTLYFEAEKEDELRKVGFSKERRVDPQIVVGLLVDRYGFPLEISCWDGAQAEKLTIVPVVQDFQARHGIEELVVVADAGMLSEANLKALDEANLRFVVGSRTSKAPIDLASHFRWHGDAFTDGQVIDTISPRNSRYRENDPDLKAEPVWDPAVHTGSWRAVWSYSAKRAARDSRTLTAQENRARAAVEGDKPARTPRFVKTKGDTLALDETALARARSLVGLKGYVSNLPITAMSTGEVIAAYHDLWHVEQSFRMSKTDLAARPMFVRSKDAIEAHLTIVFAALALARTVQNRSGLAIRRVLRTLLPLRSATIAINGAQQTFPASLNPDEQALINSLRDPHVTHQGK